jgi:L,D-transpeptidase ErfK/SrfK
VKGDDRGMTIQNLGKLRWLTSSLLLIGIGIGSVMGSRVEAEPLPAVGEQPQLKPDATVSTGGVTLVDPTLYSPVLPKIGDAATYLPDQPEVTQVRLVVRLGKRRVFVYRGKEPLASYPIAVGKPGWETPLGDYRVLNMEKNPIFKSFKSGNIIYPGADNPLGIRWIGIWTDGKTQLGFHGTNQPELIGQAVSHGCIRMHNKDVLALFSQVAIGTPVKVEP